MSEVTLLRAIKKKCLDCSGHSSEEVEKCPLSNCPLYPYRNKKVDKLRSNKQSVQSKKDARGVTESLWS